MGEGGNYKILLNSLAFAILFRLSETVTGLLKSELSPGAVNSQPLYLRLSSYLVAGVLSREDLP